MFEKNRKKLNLYIFKYMIKETKILQLNKKIKADFCE